MQINLEQLNNKFARKGNVSKTDLLLFADNNFSSIDYDTGNEVFFVARQSARWLLHSLKHDELSFRQASKVMYLKRHYTEKGSVDAWSKKPVIIDINTCTIEDGVVRLYAIALCDNPKAISLPIEFRGEWYE